MVKTSNLMARVLRTPEPPYYSVATTTEFKEAYNKQEHIQFSIELYKHAKEIDGFLGMEAFFDGNASTAVSYWKDLQSIEIWRKHPQHNIAKAKARKEWFGPTITRIALIERDYGFNL